MNLSRMLAGLLDYLPPLIRDNFGVTALGGIALCFLLLAFDSFKDVLKDKVFKPWIEPRLLVITTHGIAFMAAYTVGSYVTAAVVTASWLLFELGPRWVSLDSRVRRQRWSAAQVILPLLIVVAGIWVSAWRTQVERAGTRIYLVVAFQSTGGIDKQRIVDAWRQYCAVLRDVLEGVTSVEVKVDPDPSDEAFDRFDILSNRTAALTEVDRARPDLLFVNRVNLDPVGKAESLVVWPEIHVPFDLTRTTKLDSLPERPGVLAQIRYLALRTTWDFLRKLQHDSRFESHRISPDAYQLLKRNLLQTYAVYLKMARQPELLATVSKMTEIANVDDDEVDRVLRAMPSAAEQEEHAQSERSAREAVQRRLEIAQ